MMCYHIQNTFTFSAFERIHLTKYGSAWPSVSISLLKEACNKSSVVSMLLLKSWQVTYKYKQGGQNMQKPFTHTKVCFWKENCAHSHFGKIKELPRTGMQFNLNLQIYCNLNLKADALAIVIADAFQHTLNREKIFTTLHISLSNFIQMHILGSFAFFFFPLSLSFPCSFVLR